MKSINRHAAQSRLRSTYSLELLFAILLAALASVAAFSTLLVSPNDVYPLTSDALAHLAKVRYLADCFSNLTIPSWFPFWYNGSAVTQYYPPLSYGIMALIEVVVCNVTVTYKIFCFIMLFTGGLGTWFFCRTLIGNWCGLFGIVTYCLQPFLTRSLFNAGVLAQGPIFAITPWYLFVLLIYAKRPSRNGFFFATILCFLLIMSHAMHAFMMCLCIMIVLAFFMLNKEISVRGFATLGMSMTLGGLLASFWWIVGVTGLENPGIPYLLNDAALLYTATLEWFLPGSGSKAGLVFGFSILIACIGAVALYLIERRNGTSSKKDHYYILFHIGLTLFTIIFSFGQHLPFFELVPFYKSLVPGRILSLTSASAAILCAYLIYSIYHLKKPKIFIKKGFSLSFCILIAILMVWTINPYQERHETMDVNDEYYRTFSSLGSAGAAFEKGRYEWIAPVNCAEAYFPIQYGYNTSDGWNIEGTPHNRTIWEFNVALASQCEEFVVKNLLFWNVRSVFTLKDNELLRNALENSIYHFKYERSSDEVNPGVLYASDIPSSYFLIDQRNALTVGKGSSYIAMEFPYMVKNYFEDITKYSMEELKNYKLIYIAEPPIETLSQAKRFETTVKELINSGVTVIIEPSLSQTIPLFGVGFNSIAFEENPQLIREPSDNLKFSVDQIDFQENGTTNALYGLDEVYYKLRANGGNVKNDIVGAKNVDNGKVYFVGMHLSQFLKAGNVWINGNVGTLYAPYADQVKALISDLMNQAPTDKNYAPIAFPVIDSSWSYKGGTFEYYSATDQQVTVSVTYSPRWKLKIDDQPAPVKDRENLIVIDLPAGEHKVSLTYGISNYGILGYAITVLSIIGFSLCVMFFNSFLNALGKLEKRISLYF